jgi:DUF2997 family protein
VGGRVADEILEVTISPDGRVEMRFQGMEGMGCLDETQELISRVGGEVESQELTAEAYVEAGEEHKDRLWH